MGLSNVTQNIETQVARYLGEREQKIMQIERVERLVSELPSLRERVAKLGELITASELIMQERDPEWSVENIKAIRTYEHSSPIPFGDGSKMMLEILRTAT